MNNIFQKKSVNSTKDADREKIEPILQTCKAQYKNLKQVNLYIHFYFCILTKNIQTSFKMNNKVLLPLFALFLSMTNAAPSVQKNGKLS